MKDNLVVIVITRDDAVHRSIRTLAAFFSGYARCCYWRPQSLTSLSMRRALSNAKNRSLTLRHTSASVPTGAFLELSTTLPYTLLVLIATYLENWLTFKYILENAAT